MTVITDELQPTPNGGDTGNPLDIVEFVSAQELNKALDENKRLVREAGLLQHKLIQLENSVSTGRKCCHV